MLIAPALMAAALTLDLQGLTVITPWKSTTESTARVWVFLPNTSDRGMIRHRATLVLERGAVVADDWQPQSERPDGRGVWDIEGYVLSVYREGVKESPDRLLTWASGKEPHPWESLRWVLNLNRVVPNGRIAQDPFANQHAIAAVKLSDGDLDATEPRGSHAGQIWVVEPVAEKYQQAFTDTVRYKVDLKDAASELRLDPVPGGNKPSRRIRLVTTKDITATIVHLPEGKSPVTNGHASAAAGLLADKASRDRVASMTVHPGAPDMGGNPLCDSLIFNIRPRPQPTCIRCAIDLAPALRR